MFHVSVDDVISMAAGPEKGFSTIKLAQCNGNSLHIVIESRQSIFAVTFCVLLQSHNKTINSLPLSSCHDHGCCDYPAEHEVQLSSY